jgi:hypothetical protein
MNSVLSNERISTSKRIRALGLPAREQNKALAMLGLVNALLTPLFSLLKRSTSGASGTVTHRMLRAQ